MTLHYALTRADTKR